MAYIIVNAIGTGSGGIKAYAVISKKRHIFAMVHHSPHLLHTPCTLTSNEAENEDGHRNFIPCPSSL